jgi:UPF0755 protein
LVRTILRILIGILLVAAAVAGGTAYYAWSAYFGTTAVAEPRLVRIAPGSGPRRVAQLIAEAGLGRSADWVYRGMRWQGHLQDMKAGVYRFEGRMSAADAVAAVAAGRVDLVAVTLPEGLTARQIGKVLAEAGVIVDAEAFAAFALDRASAARWGLPGPGLEGFLYPDTYRFARELAPEKVAEAMVRRFREVADGLSAETSADPAALLHWVTLASIVEKETGRPEERPLIASVFQNRLRRGMRLQTDPTVIYGIVGFDGNLRREDLLRDGPYNTYMRKGLPPGPIANAGRDSLAAALRPPLTGYLYFVSRNDGSHEFSETYERHEAAVAHYQLRRGRR